MVKIVVDSGTAKRAAKGLLWKVKDCLPKEVARFSVTRIELIVRNDEVLLVTTDIAPPPKPTPTPPAREEDIPF